MKRPIVSVWPIDPEPSGRLRLGESRLPQFPLGILPTGIGKDVAAAAGHQGEGRRFLDDPFRRWQTKHSGISNSAPAPLTVVNTAGRELSASKFFRLFTGNRV